MIYVISLAQQDLGLSDLVFRGTGGARQTRKSGGIATITWTQQQLLK
jgi:hypothetical protein